MASGSWRCQGNLAGARESGGNSCEEGGSPVQPQRARSCGFRFKALPGQAGALLSVLTREDGHGGEGREVASSGGQGLVRRAGAAQDCPVVALEAVGRTTELYPGPRTCWLYPACCNLGLAQGQTQREAQVAAFCTLLLPQSESVVTPTVGRGLCMGTAREELRGDIWGGMGPQSFPRGLAGLPLCILFEGAR